MTSGLAKESAVGEASGTIYTGLLNSIVISTGMGIGIMPGGALKIWVANNTWSIYTGLPAGNFVLVRVACPLRSSDSPSNSGIAIMTNGTGKRWGSMGSGTDSGSYIWCAIDGVYYYYYVDSTNVLHSNNSGLPAGSFIRVEAGYYPETDSSYIYMIAQYTNGSLVYSGGAHGPSGIPAGMGYVKDYACGAAHAVAIDSAGAVHAWGNNAYGQCNVPAGLPPCIAVGAGWLWSTALDVNGTLHAWGATWYPSPGGSIADMNNIPGLACSYGPTASRCGALVPVPTTTRRQIDIRLGTRDLRQDGRRRIGIYPGGF